MLAFVKHIQLLRYESLKAWMFGEILSQKKEICKDFDKQSKLSP